MGKQKVVAVVAAVVLLVACGGSGFTTADGPVDGGGDTVMGADTRLIVVADSASVDSGSADVGLDVLETDSVAVDGMADSGGTVDAILEAAAFDSDTMADGDGCTPVTHSNGAGQMWTDCVPLGTYNETQAMKACAAQAVTEPAIYSCIASSDVCSAEMYVESTGGFGIWTYAGPFTGYFGPGNCPTSSDPMWN